FAQTMDLTVALQNKTAPVECAQRRAVPDRHDGGTVEACVEKAIEHGFRRLIERSRRLVQQKVVWRLQDGAGNSEALLLTEREHAVPVRLFAQPSGQRVQSDGSDDFAQDFGVKR